MSSWQPPQVLIWFTGDSGDSGSPPLNTVCRLPWQPLQSLMARSPWARRPWMLPAMALNSSSWQSWHTWGLTGPSGLRGWRISRADSWQSAHSSLRCAERPKWAADTDSDLPSSSFISGSSWQLRHFCDDTCGLSAAGVCAAAGAARLASATATAARAMRASRPVRPPFSSEPALAMTCAPCNPPPRLPGRQTGCPGDRAFSTGAPAVV